MFNKAGNYIRINQNFVDACHDGNLKTLEEIVLQYDNYHPSKNKFINIAQTFFNKKLLDVHYYDDRCFRYACDKGHLDVVDFLLTDNRLSEKCNINAEEDFGFRIACTQGNLDLVKYLTSSPKLTKHANIYANNSCGIIHAYENNNIDILKFLIFDLHIEKNEDIQKYINETNALSLESLFSTRLSFENLTENLTIKSLSETKIKRKI